MILPFLKRPVCQTTNVFISFRPSILPHVKWVLKVKTECQEHRGLQRNKSQSKSFLLFPYVNETSFYFVIYESKFGRIFKA